MKRLFVFAVCLLILAGLWVPVTASSQEQEGEEKIVRVGWYESAFHSTDEFGRRSGYGYEYQQRIATFTGWTYEYVEGSWSELFEMLVAGEIDLLSDVSYTEERAEQILYSSEAMGSEDYHVFISPDNTEIRPDDFSTFNGKTVGVNKNSIQEQMFIDWADKHGVTPEIIECTEKTPEMLDMLARGDFDMLVTLDTYGNTADIVPVCKIGSADSYFGINKARPDIKQELDVAMNRIFESNRDFNQQMTERLNKSSAVSSFLTQEEKDWVGEHGTIRVGYRDEFMPYCAYDKDTDSLDGALLDFLNFARTCEKNAVLDFETQPYPTPEEALEALENGRIDCVFPVNLSAYDAEERGFIITDPFVNTGMYAAVRSSDHEGLSPDRDMTVAVLNGHTSHETFLMDYFPGWEKKYYNSNAEDFKAVASGEADCTLVSNYRINWVSDLLSKYDLAAISTGETMDLCFAMNREDDCLYSIINKVIRQYPDTTKNSSLTHYSFKEEKVSFVDFIRDNLAVFIAVVAAIVVVILLLVIRSLRSEARASEGRRLISETERDPLTGLYNWNYFLAYANRIFKEHPEKHMDAVVINIDRFHSVNDLHGRDFGDQVLQTVGEAIRNFLESTEGIACRALADRFDLYCLSRNDWWEKITSLQDRVDSLSRNASIRLRMGVKPWKEGMEPLVQIDRARTACNSIRGDYKNNLMVYDEKMGLREERDQRLLNDLRQALDEKQFRVWYQPKYNIKGSTPQLASAEALSRWVHPDLGIITPDEFIPLLENSGQITLLDHYVWEQAAAQIASWRERYGIALPISVNLSRVDVFDPDLIITLDGLVQKYGLKNGDLKLEVTESAYTENAEFLIRVIELLRQKGYEIEMDDFGSGYSSLNMLSAMPVDILKMDMAFVQNIERNEDDLHLVELIIDIARYLHVPVIAEGVETEKQMNLLRDAGCDLVQGYYFSPPLPPDEFERKILSDA